MSKLQVFLNNEMIEEVTLDNQNEYIAGRGDEATIRLLPELGISRQHFKIFHDGSSWKIEGLSSMKKIEINGQEVDNWDLGDRQTFYLSPYRFVFLPDQESMDALPEDEGFDDMASSDDELLQDEDSLPNPHEEDSAPDFSQPPSDENSDSFPMDGEKTVIQSFSGTPYIKISGQYGRKPECFRLEGHLWVAGSDNNAAIYLSDLNASPAHFEISKTDQGFFICDLGSSTGTIVNGQSIHSHKKMLLSSGDHITVGELSLQFEVRDKSFREKINNIPLHMYQNPLVFFDQDAGVLSTAPEELKGAGRAEEIRMAPKKKEAPQNNRKKIIYACVAVVMLTAVFKGLEPSGEDQKTTKKPSEMSPFEKLSPAQQKMVKDTYRIATDFYLNAKYDRALPQFQKLHKLLPDGYKDSLRKLEYCENYQDLKQQQMAIERQKREQAELEQRIAQSVESCAMLYRNSMDLDGAKSCLAEVIQLDPNNPGINDILNQITARIEQKNVAEKQAAEMAEKARRGRNLFLKAKALHDNQDLQKAMEAYENHIYSGLPDPDALVAKSKRQLSSIEKKIHQKKINLMSSAQSFLGQSSLKEALKMARQAREVDPYDYQISHFVNKVEKELTGKMKSLYMDSVIEERFGNLNASRSKWEEIVKQDVEDGEYYKKAKRKLKQYGF